MTMKKLKGMRKASLATRDNPLGHYVQISLDISDGEILTVLLKGEPVYAWKPYQSGQIFPVINTAEFMTEAEIAAAAHKAYAPAAEALERLARKTAVLQYFEQVEESHRQKEIEEKQLEYERQMFAGKLDVEDYLAGNGLYVPQAKEGEIVYCADCLSDDCDNWRHHRYLIDGMMYPILKTVHTKGYKTESSCAGHADRVNGEHHTYLFFTGVHNFQAPQGYGIDPRRDSNDRRTRVTIISQPNAWKQKTLVKHAQAALDHQLSVLREWVDELPDISG